MKALRNRLRRLEIAEIPHQRERSMAEAILAARRKRRGPDHVEEFLPVDYTGCRTMADYILRARQARMEHERTRSDAS